MDNDSKKIALNAMQRYCAKQETCTFDIKRKLGYYQLSDEEKTEVIENLVNEGFVDEERYARIFVRDKFKLNKWGRIKIGFQLKAKMIPDGLINKSLSEISKDDYEQTLEEEVRKKVKRNNSPEDKAKIVRHFQSRGFELDFILRAWDNLKDD